MSASNGMNCTYSFSSFQRDAWTRSSIESAAAYLRHFNSLILLVDTLYPAILSVFNVVIRTHQILAMRVAATVIGKCGVRCLILLAWVVSIGFPSALVVLFLSRGEELGRIVGGRFFMAKIGSLTVFSLTTLFCHGSVFCFIRRRGRIAAATVKVMNDVIKSSALTLVAIWLSEVS